MKSIITIVLIFFSISTNGQTCKHDSIFTYKFRDILPETIGEINLDSHNPYSIDIMEDGKKIKTHLNPPGRELKEQYDFFYNNNGLISKEVISSWITGIDDIEIDSTIFVYQDSFLIEKMEYRTSSFFSRIKTSYSLKNDTIIESKVFNGLETLLSKSYHPQNDSVYMEVICNVSPHGYTLQKLDSHGEIFEIYYCTNNNDCKLKQKRKIVYDDCDRIVEKGVQYPNTSRMASFKILKYK